MAISVNEIAVHKSYVTATGQLRRVLKVDNGTVTYEEARGKAVSGNWGFWTTVGDGKFAPCLVDHFRQNPRALFPGGKKLSQAPPRP